MTMVYEAGVPDVKIDPDSKLGSPWIKTESELMDVPSGGQIDEDIYEDAGDLDFSTASQGLYLTRIPDMLWKSWSELDDEQEICLGTMSLLLGSDIAARESLPREYVLEVTHPDSLNTFIFSEKDLPGYTSKLHEATKLGGQSAISLSQRLLQQERSKYGPQGIDKARRFQSRRGIPKQTAIAGRIQKELRCLPVDNYDFRRIMDIRVKSGKEKSTTGFKSGPIGTEMPADAGKSFESFIKMNKIGKKSQKLKAARIPENELLDQISKCFQSYTFWSLKSLIHEIRQPEQYLKQTLERVAVLIRSGRHAGLWQLKSDLKRFDDMKMEPVKMEQAPDVNSPRESDYEFEDVEDDNVEMQDVLIEE